MIYALFYKITLIIGVNTTGILVLFMLAVSMYMIFTLVDIIVRYIVNQLMKGFSTVLNKK